MDSGPFLSTQLSKTANYLAGYQLWHMVNSLAGQLGPTTSSPLQLTEQSIPRVLVCIHFLVPLHMALPLFGKSLLVLQDQDQISSLRAMLQFSLTGSSTQGSFLLPFALVFMIAVNHSIWGGLIYVSAFPTRKPRTCTLRWVSSQHGASFLALSRLPINREYQRRA